MLAICPFLRGIRAKNLWTEGGKLGVTLVPAVDSGHAEAQLQPEGAREPKIRAKRQPVLAVLEALRVVAVNGLGLRLWAGLP